MILRSHWTSLLILEDLKRWFRSWTSSPSGIFSTDVRDFAEVTIEDTARELVDKRNFSIRLLFVSVTKRYSSASNAIPAGRFGAIVPFEPLSLHSRFPIERVEHGYWKNQRHEEATSSRHNADLTPFEEERSSQHLIVWRTTLSEDLFITADEQTGRSREISDNCCSWEGINGSRIKSSGEVPVVPTCQEDRVVRTDE